MHYFTLATSFLLTCCLFLSCKEEIETLDLDRGIDYFPLATGKYVEYQLDSIIFDDGPGGTNVKDTVTVFVRELISDQMIDASGDTTYRLEIFRRASQADPWRLSDVWTAQRREKEAIRVEENQRFVKLLFPLRNGLQWNSLVYLNPDVTVKIGTETIEMYKNWYSEIISFDQPETIGEHPFQHVLTCIHADDDNEIELRYVMEKYARGVGLVSREMSILDSRCIRIGDLGPCAGQSWIEKAEKGFILKQVILDFN